MSCCSCCCCNWSNCCCCKAIRSAKLTTPPTAPAATVTVGAAVRVEFGAARAVDAAVIADTADDAPRFFSTATAPLPTTAAAKDGKCSAKSVDTVPAPTVAPTAVPMEGGGGATGESVVVVKGSRNAAAVPATDSVPDLLFPLSPRSMSSPMPDSAPDGGCGTSGDGATGTDDACGTTTRK